MSKSMTSISMDVNKDRDVYMDMDVHNFTNVNIKDRDISAGRSYSYFVTFLRNWLLVKAMSLRCPL